VIVAAKQSTQETQANATANTPTSTPKPVPTEKATGTPKPAPSATTRAPALTPLMATSTAAPVATVVPPPPNTIVPIATTATSPIDFETFLGKDWAPLPAKTKTAAMEAYRADHPNIIGRCSGAVGAGYMVFIVDNLAAQNPYREMNLDTVTSLALAKNGCLR